MVALAGVLAGCGGGGPAERSTTIPPPQRASAKATPHPQPPKSPPPREPAPRAHDRQPEPVPGQLWGRQFAAGSFQRSGHPPVPIRHTRFWFSRVRLRGHVRGAISWDDGCNGFGGFLRVRGSSLRAWNVAGTLVACVSVGPDGKPRRERGPILMNLFGGTLRWHLHGERLVLGNGNWTLRLRERRS
jgi:heat shock protein HslJ